MGKLRALLCALAIAIPATPSSADGGDAWVKQTTDKGCFVYIYRQVYAGIENAPDPEGYIWSGQCTPGQPINGEGVLYGQYKLPDFRIVRSTQGRFVNGYPNGTMRLLAHDVSADGKWDPVAGKVEMGVDTITLEMGCPWVGGECVPGRVNNPIAIRQVSPPYFPLPGSKAAGATQQASSAPLKYPSPTPPLTTERVQTTLPSGAILNGSTNLKCLVFEPRTGPEARSMLVNRCGEEVRLNYCLIYIKDHDNCAPMKVRWEATLWPLRAGAWLNMPAADTMKLYSVFGCIVPLHPLNAVFRDGVLTDGHCFEDGLAPPMSQPGERLTVVRSNDPSTWPPGNSNRETCLRLSPRLDRYLTAYLVNDCGTDLNIAVCSTHNGSPMTPNLCAIGPVLYAGRPPVSPSMTVMLGKPNSYKSWHAFACDAPLEPAELYFDGTRLTGECKAT